MIPINDLIIFCAEKKSAEVISNYDEQHYNDIIDTLTIISGGIPNRAAFNAHNEKALLMKKEVDKEKISAYHKSWREKKRLKNIPQETIGVCWE